MMPNKALRFCVKSLFKSSRRICNAHNCSPHFFLDNDFPRGCQIDYVLGQFTLDERQRLPQRTEVAVDAIKTFVLAGLQTAMCDFNNK